MTAAQEPSMDDILKSIRRIIRSDKDEVVNQEEPVRIKPEQDKPSDSEDNLIMMEIHDQKRLRILEKKLQTVEAEYEQKLQLHRRKMIDYRRQNQELVTVVEEYRSKLDVLTDGLKTAHSCLESLQIKNKALKDKILQISRFEQGSAVLKTIQREFANLYHPERVEGDNLSKTVRHEVYSEFSQVLQGVRSRFHMDRI